MQISITFPSWSGCFWTMPFYTVFQGVLIRTEYPLTICDLTPTGLPPFPVSFPRTHTVLPGIASPINFLSPKSLPQGLLLGEPSKQHTFRNRMLLITNKCPPHPSVQSVLQDRNLLDKQDLGPRCRSLESVSAL